MIGRITQRNTTVDVETQKGFDDYDLRLGDVLRGERATLGKSLLDVQRELRIKAAYIAAIENCDPEAFDTPGFIAGYVRSYARYLGMDPDATFASFCAESGFATAHGMSDKASSAKPVAGLSTPGTSRDPFTEPTMPFAPARESVFAGIEPGAIGSVLVLVALIGGVGYGGWSVLQEIQRVQMAPVDQTPVVLSDLDPLSGVTGGGATNGAVAVAGVFDPPKQDGFDRLYRPEALDVPVLIARDAPISTLDPASVGAFARIAKAELPEVETESFDFVEAETLGTLDPIEQALAEVLGGAQLPQVLEPLGPGVMVVAARQSWVRVRDASGSTIYEAIMQPGDTYAVPQLEAAPNIRVGESGAIYFAVNGQTYGPAGQNGAVTRNLALSVDNLTTSYEVADIASDRDLEKVIAELSEDLLGQTDP